MKLHIQLSKSCWMLTACVFLSLSVLAAPVRISFLRDKESIQNTLDFLTSQGCSSDAIGSFKKIVEYYNAKPLDLDFGKFPPAQNGFYSFESVTQLLAVIPHQLKDQPLPWAFNCFDTTILLGSGQFRTGLHPDDHSGDFLAQGVAPDGKIQYAHAETAREAYNLSYAQWYQDVSSAYFAPSMTDNRICLTAVLYSFHMLPESTADKDASDQVMKTLRTEWKWQAITFPTRFQVVLCHQVNVQHHYFATTHSGLLFTAGKSYVFIEKCGGSGPFVRFDFKDKTDLAAWLVWKFEGHDKPPGSYVLATFNDEKIEAFHIAR